MRSSVHGRLRAGFTVVELMVVILVVGVMAASVMPAISDLRADSRQSGAAHEVVRMGRRARAMTMETGVAHLLRFNSSNDAAGAFGLGRFELFRGMTNRCRQTPWLQAFTAISGNPMRIDPTTIEGADVLDMRTFTPASEATGPRPIIWVSATTAGGTVARTAVQLCFQPNGQTYEAFSATAAGSSGAALSPQQGPITFTVSRGVGESAGAGTRGVSRQVVFPIGGNARVRY